MVDYCRHFAFVILDEGQLRPLIFEEKIRFRFWIQVEFTAAAVPAQGLPDQLISLSPERQFDSGGKRVPGANSYWPAQAS